jgi:NAD(P)H-hydrate repair Nnr-like enzyme with NAD(P)H-hydrate epimerase domain
MVGPETLMSDAGAALWEKLREDADNRDPDRFDMYIYNGNNLGMIFRLG